MRDSRSASPDDARLLHAACFFALFCVGFYATSFGPALPFFARKLNVDLDTAGLLITGIFVGSIIASGAVTLGLGRGQMRIAVATGLLVASLGLFGLGFAHQWWVALGAVVLLGLGDGLIVAGAHVLIANTSRDVPAAITQESLFEYHAAFDSTGNWVTFTSERNGDGPGKRLVIDAVLRRTADGVIHGQRRVGRPVAIDGKSRGLRAGLGRARVGGEDVNDGERGRIRRSVLTYARIIVLCNWTRSA